MLEVEIKAYIKDPAEFRERLKNAGAEKLRKRHDRDRYFNHPSRDFARTDEAVRIRTVDGAACLTYKGPKISQRSKARIEEEVGVEDEAVMNRILTSLGFVEVFTVEKERELWSFEKIEICLDEVSGLGNFAELEVITNDREQAEDRLFALAAKLGLEHFETRSYLELLLEKNQD